MIAILAGTAVPFCSAAMPISVVRCPLLKRLAKALGVPVTELLE